MNFEEVNLDDYGEIDIIYPAKVRKIFHIHHFGCKKKSTVIDGVVNSNEELMANIKFYFDEFDKRSMKWGVNSQLMVFVEDSHPLCKNKQNAWVFGFDYIKSSRKNEKEFILFPPSEERIKSSQ